MLRYFIPFLFLWPRSVSGQLDSLDYQSKTEDLIESFLQEQEHEGAFEYNDLFEDLASFRQHPLDLNKVTGMELDRFPFLTPIQKSSLLNYLSAHGPLLSIYELQAIPGLDLQTIQLLLPFVKIGQNAVSPLLKNWASEGQQQLIMRWSRTLERKKGFVQNEDGERRFAGDPNQYYLRYRYTFSNRLSFGFTAEKDEGESFFRGSNRSGFDFYSAHFYFFNPRGKLKTLAIGDFSVSMGQGLLLFNGFSTRKGPVSTQIKRLGSPLSRYSSVNENDFLRGVGLTCSLSKKLAITSFVSVKKTDANIEVADTFNDDEPLALFATSFQNSGKHRTSNEIADENSIRQTTAGSVLNWNHKRWQISLNALFNHFDKNLNRNVALYNQYYFNGQQLFNTSIDYSYSWRNIHLFGETAWSGNHAFASSNGALITLDQKLDIAMLYRHFPATYQAINPRPFAETTGARNETGLYLGFELKPLPQWTINAYFDQWKHPWLRFRTDAPSSGHEWLFRINYKIRKKLESHVQIKNELKSENIDEPEGRYDQVFERQNLQARFHLSYQLNKRLEWRSRFYAGFTKIYDSTLKGTALFQDLKYRSVGSPISIAVRYAIFDTADYAIRFYAYENDVLNSFTVPAYFDQGSKFYILTGLRLGTGKLIEVRMSRLSFTNRHSVGSGNDEIAGPNRTDIKVQFRWNF